MSKKDETLTWAELKKAINRMPKKHLNKPVCLWADEQGFKIVEVEILKEDYLFDGDEGCAPRSTMKEVIDGEKDFPPEDKGDYYVVHEKGTRILYIE